MAQDVSHAHHIEITESDAHVRIARDGVMLADTNRPVLLKEGSLPTRYYIEPDDVRVELLVPADTTSHCPFKGDATYWSTATLERSGGADIAWCYRTPIPGADRIAGLVCFYNEKVDIEVDGKVLDRPRTRWS